MPPPGTGRTSTATTESDAMAIERSCSVTAVAFSEQRISGVRLMSGPRRTFGLNAGHDDERPSPRWTVRPSGVALQCPPSKAGSTGSVCTNSPTTARGARRDRGRGCGGLGGPGFPGLIPELDRLAPGISISTRTLDGEGDHRPARWHWPGRKWTCTRTRFWAGSPVRPPESDSLAARVQTGYGRMPWTSSRTDAKRLMSIPVGGDGGVRNSNLPPPSPGTTRSRSIRISGWVSRTPSGTCGIRRSCPIMLRCSNVGTRPATVRSPRCPRHPQMVRRTHPPRHPQRPRRWLRRRRRPASWRTTPDTITGRSRRTPDFPGTAAEFTRIYRPAARRLLVAEFQQRRAKAFASNWPVPVACRGR